jgi:hypothetical protein
MLNILISYAYISDDLIMMIRDAQARGLPLRILLDSGAFTAWSTGKKIDMMEYARFVRDAIEQGWVWKYFTLDVIGDHEATRTNYDRLRELGLDPIPIFTPGTPEALLEEYFEKSHLVGFGGINAYKGDRRDGYVNYCMRLAKGRDAHLLGMTKLDPILFHRPYMCDSSSWAAAAQYAVVSLYVQGKIVKRFNRNTFKTKPPEDLLRLIRWYGIEPYSLKDHSGWNHMYSPSRKLSIASSVVRSIDIERTIGTKYFNALTSPDQLKMFIEAFERLHDKGRPPR